MARVVLKLMSVGFLAGLTVCAGCLPTGNSKKIHIVGKSSAGNETVVSLPSAGFQSVMVTAMDRIHRNTLNTLDETVTQRDLKLSRVTLGLNLEIEAGIKNIIEIGAEGAFELRYEPLPIPGRIE